jgi:hypothetical protein
MSILAIPTLLKSARLETTLKEATASILCIANRCGEGEVFKGRLSLNSPLVLEDLEITASIAKLSADAQNKGREGRKFKAIANFKDIFAKTAGNVFKLSLGVGLS